MEIKSKFFVFILVICISLSITAVSASDNQTDFLNNDLNSNDQIEVNDNDLNEKLMQTNESSYDDFYEDIKDCGDSFNIKSNYKYNESNHWQQLKFNQTNLVINGNNHVIDGSNKAYGFNFTNDTANITINDLTFINCDQSIILSTGNLFLNNVNFTNNFVKTHKGDEGIVRITEDGNLTLNNCNFDSNIKSILISLSNADVYIYNSKFYNTKNTASMILFQRGSLTMENSVFENLSTRYGVVNLKGDNLKIKNSTFKNLYADLTGGAILAKYCPIAYTDPDTGEEELRPSQDMVIDSCIFSNVSSGHNGGAIYIDLATGYKDHDKPIHIINCNFTDTSSQFGGVIAEQGGFLNISKSNFINSRADELGGVIYISYGNLTVAQSNISNCSAKLNAGAIYFDKGELIIAESNFTKNKVDKISSGKECVIYANEVIANIYNSTFENGIVAVYANFANESNIKDITSSDLFLMNNTDYIVSVENKGIRLNLTNNSIVVDKLPAKFDSRDWGWVSPLKYQGDSMACWAFATAGTLECALLKQTGVLYNISEDNINNLQLKFYAEGDARVDDTGFAYSGLGHSLSWYGVVTAQDDVFDERGMFSNVVETENRIHLQDAMIIFGGRNDTMDLLKWAIIKYGAVSVQFSIDPFDYNQTEFTDNETQPGHFVTLIGWDDNYPATNFNGSESVKDNIPKSDGAWLVKDSENKYLNESECTYMGEAGYLRISYCNPSFLAKDLLAEVPQAAGIAYIFENTVDYHVNYQTDLTGLTGFDGNYTYYSNEFTSKYSELIGAVGTYFNDSGINYSFDIYVNGEKIHSQSGISEFAGFRTIVLNQYIPVNAGDKFKVVFKNNALPYQAFSRQHYMQGMTFVSSDGKSWEDITLNNKTVCLKVYTVADDTKITQNRDIVVDYDGGSYFSVKVITADGHMVKDAEVKFTINGKTTAVKTDNNGIAQLLISDVPGQYSIITNYKGQNLKNTVTVKQVLTTSKVTVKKTAKNIVLKAALKINGKAVKEKTVIFTFKGKTYKAKTNAKGIAEVKIAKSVLLKLKNNKNYQAKVTYLKDTIKTTVKALDVVILKASKVTVKKAAKKLTLKATLKINGKAAKGKKIKFHFNGKTYKAKTNKKGIAKKVLKRNVIKKLKKGKTYKVKVTYLKHTIKTTVKFKG